MPTPDPKALARYESIAEGLAAVGVTKTKMMGMPALKTKGKMFAGVWGDAMNFKLEGDNHARALKLKGAELFDPSGAGRAMKEWVVLPAPHAKRWAEFAEAARRYVTS